MKKRILACLLAGVLAAAAGSCRVVPYQEGIQHTQSDTAANSTAFTSYDGQFHVTTPPGWYDTGYTDDLIVLNLSSGDDLVYLSIYPEDKREYDGCSLDEYADLMLESWDVERPAFTPPSYLYIDGAPARLDCMDCTIDGTSMRMWAYTQEFGDIFVQYVFGSTADNADRAEKTIEIIAQSIYRTGGYDYNDYSDDFYNYGDDQPGIAF